MSLSPEMAARIDALIAQSREWQNQGRCYACGRSGTHRVTLQWMGDHGGGKGRIYCTFHAGEWSLAGWPNHVHPIPPADGPA